jgi:hypothetical protein
MVCTCKFYYCLSILSIVDVYRVLGNMLLCLLELVEKRSLSFRPVDHLTSTLHPM